MSRRRNTTGAQRAAARRNLVKARAARGKTSKMKKHHKLLRKHGLEPGTDAAIEFTMARIRARRV